MESLYADGKEQKETNFKTIEGNSFMHDRGVGKRIYWYGDVISTVPTLRDEGGYASPPWHAMHEAKSKRWDHAHDFVFALCFPFF